MSTTKDIGLIHFESVLQEVLEQVSNGKGNERHGNGEALYAQPWAWIAGTVGSGFLVGQAMKKIIEANTMINKEGYTGAQYEREMLGAIAYLTFAIMHNREHDANKETN